MSLFRDLYPTRVIASHHDFHELERMIEQSVQRGFVKEVPIRRRLHEGPLIRQSERWFLDVESGEIYSLHDPGERSCGYWDIVLTDELSQGSSLTQ